MVSVVFLPVDKNQCFADSIYEYGNCTQKYEKIENVLKIAEQKNANLNRDVNFLVSITFVLTGLILAKPLWEVLNVFILQFQSWERKLVGEYRTEEKYKKIECENYLLKQVVNNIVSIFEGKKGGNVNLQVTIAKNFLNDNGLLRADNKDSN